MGKFSNVFLHLMIAGCGEHVFVSSKMSKNAYLRSVHAHEKKSVGGVSFEHADDVDDHTSADDADDVDDHTSADDVDDVDDHTLADDADDVDDHTSHDDVDDADDHTSADDVSVDDGVVRPIGAPSADDTSVDDSTASGDDVDDADDGVPNAVVVVQGITDMVNDLIDNNFGTPPPTPAPTAKEVDEGNAIDDVVNTITDAIGDIMNP